MRKIYKTCSKDTQDFVINAEALGVYHKSRSWFMECRPMKAYVMYESICSGFQRL